MAEEKKHEDYYDEGPVEPTIEEQQLWELESISVRCEEQRKHLEEINGKLDDITEKFEKFVRELENGLIVIGVIFILIFLLSYSIWGPK